MADSESTLIDLFAQAHKRKKDREKTARWRFKHSGKLKIWKLKNKEKIREWQATYFQKHPVKAMLTKSKCRAKRDGVPFAITERDVTIPEFCPYEGIRLERGKGIHCDASPSLDKIIPELGYVPGNIAVISKRANSRKQDMSPKEMRRYADIAESLLADHLKH